jgi:hypothetical protein
MTEEQQDEERRYSFDILVKAKSPVSAGGKLEKSSRAPATLHFFDKKQANHGPRYPLS